MQNNQPQTSFEELCNALSHIVFSILFLFLFIDSREFAPSAYSLIFSIMFFSSFLYHSPTRWKRMFRHIDQFFIYVAIGASGLLVPKSFSPYGTVLILSLLSLSAIHHVMRCLFDISEGHTVPIFYLMNGIVSGAVIISSQSSSNEMLYASLGVYFLGFIFYVNDHIKYFHTVWHILCSLAAYYMYCHLISNLS